MKRREFVTFLGGAAATWPLAARAQQSNRVRRISLLLPFSANVPELQGELAIFKKGLQEAGWTEGHNVRLELRYTDPSAEQIRIAAAELVASGRHHLGHQGHEGRPAGDRRALLRGDREDTRR